MKQIIKPLLLCFFITVGNVLATAKTSNLTTLKTGIIRCYTTLQGMTSSVLETLNPEEIVQVYKLCEGLIINFIKMHQTARTLSDRIASESKSDKRDEIYGVLCVLFEQKYPNTKIEENEILAGHVSEIKEALPINIFRKKLAVILKQNQDLVEIFDSNFYADQDIMRCLNFLPGVFERTELKDLSEKDLQSRLTLCLQEAIGLRIFQIFQFPGIFCHIFDFAGCVLYHTCRPAAGLCRYAETRLVLRARSGDNSSGLVKPITDTSKNQIREEIKRNFGEYVDEFLGCLSDNDPKMAYNWKQKLWKATQMLQTLPWINLEEYKKKLATYTGPHQSIANELLVDYEVCKEQPSIFILAQGYVGLKKEFLGLRIGVDGISLVNPESSPLDPDRVKEIIESRGNAYDEETRILFSLLNQVAKKYDLDFIEPTSDLYLPKLENLLTQVSEIYVVPEIELPLFEGKIDVEIKIYDEKIKMAKDVVQNFFQCSPYLQFIASQGFQPDIDPSIQYVKSEMKKIERLRKSVINMSNAFKNSEFDVPTMGRHIVDFVVSHQHTIESLPQLASVPYNLVISSSCIRGKGRRKNIVLRVTIESIINEYKKGEVCSKTQIFSTECMNILERIIDRLCEARPIDDLEASLALTELGICISREG